MSCKVQSQRYPYGSGCSKSTFPMTLCLNSDSRSIVTMTIGDRGGGTRRKYWKAELQRKVLNSYTWVTIGTREGYVSPNSPSYRPFTNVKRVPGASYRVRVRFGGNGCPYNEEVLSPFIVH